MQFISGLLTRTERRFCTHFSPDSASKWTILAWDNILKNNLQPAFPVMFIVLENSHSTKDLRYLPFKVFYLSHRITPFF